MERELVYVGENKAKYAQKFKRIEEGKISWNWCAFLIPGFWLLYRKMYKIFLVLIGLSVVETTVGYFMPGKTYEGISLAVSIFVSVGLALIADKLYYDRIKTLVADEEGKTQADIDYAVEKYGGTSPGSVWVFVIVVLLLVGVVYGTFPV